MVCLSFVKLLLICHYRYYVFYKAQHKGAIYCVVLILGANLMLQSPHAALLVGPQQSVTDIIYIACNTTTFSSNDAFDDNFKVVVDSLIQNSSKTLYSIAASESGSESSYVYGIYQCRGEVSFPDCQSCVNNALSGILKSYTGCNSLARGARVQYKGCFIRYENYAFFTGFEKDGLHLADCSNSNDSDPLYQHNVAAALNDSAAAAPRHALFGYNATNIGNGSHAAFALTQCMGYLSPSECATCLAQVSNYSAECNKSVSGEIYLNSCYYLYGNTSVLFTYINDTSGTNSPASAPHANSSPRSPDASPTQERNYKRSTPVVVGVVVGFSLAVLAAIAALALVCLRKKNATSSGHEAQGALLHAFDDRLPHELRATRFLLKDLQEATEDFHPRNKLGEGGFGPVYQGTLKSGQEVAIKMLSAESHQGSTEFLNEVNLITSVQHRNLIQLLGCCVNDNNQLLVYEYLPKRSLDLHLFDVTENDALKWRTRFDIIVGIARGLQYLHKDSHVRIVHRDVKTSNILLDNNMKPKITDFGLARFFTDDTSHVTTRVMGTFGYLAPEYAIGGQLTYKADVYSFGVVALEVVSGRRVLERKFEADKQNLLEWAWMLYEQKQLVQIVDKRLEEGSGMLKKDVNVGEVVRVVHVALLCTQSQPQLRPSMLRVHNMLSTRSDILELPTKPITYSMSPPNNALQDSTLSSSSMPSWTCEATSLVTNSYDRDPISEVQPR